MAYNVIKTVKGHKYLYRQRSYREGGKVRTHSEYLGPVTGDGGLKFTAQSSKSNRSPDKSTPSNADSGQSDINPESTQPRHSGNKPTSPAGKVLSLQKPTFKLKQKHLKVSEVAYTREYQRQIKRLESFGIQAENFPKITVKHSGKGYGFHKAAFKNEIVITAPRGKGNREKLRKAYREALHHSFITTLERNKPEQLHAFKYAFDKSYQRTQDSLTRYLQNCNSKDSFARVIAIKWFCRMNPVPTGRGAQLKPEQLGLVEYGDRKNWKQEYCTLMAAIDKKGISTLREQASQEISKSTALQRRYIKEKSIFWIRRRRAIKRQQARINANRELLHKLDLVDRWLR